MYLTGKSVPFCCEFDNCMLRHIFEHGLCEGLKIGFTRSAFGHEKAAGRLIYTALAHVRQFTSVLHKFSSVMHPQPEL